MSYYPNIEDGSINPVGTIYGLFYTHDDHLLQTSDDLQSLKDIAADCGYLMYIVPVKQHMIYRADWETNCHTDGMISEFIPTWQNGKSVKFGDKNAYSRPTK